MPPAGVRPAAPGHLPRPLQVSGPWGTLRSQWLSFSGWAGAEEQAGGWFAFVGQVGGIAVVRACDSGLCKGRGGGGAWGGRVLGYLRPEGGGLGKSQQLTLTMALACPVLRCGLYLAESTAGSPLKAGARAIPMSKAPFKEIHSSPQMTYIHTPMKSCVSIHVFKRHGHILEQLTLTMALAIPVLRCGLYLAESTVGPLLRQALVPLWLKCRSRGPTAPNQLSA